MTSAVQEREGIRGISGMARGRGEADVGGGGDGAAGQGEGGQKVRILNEGTQAGSL